MAGWGRGMVIAGGLGLTGDMDFDHILVERSGEFATITMNRPQRRNALSLEHMGELIRAFGEIGGSDALGIVLAGNGPVFCAGHDFADVADADLTDVRSLLMTCTELMTLMQQVPQPVVARVHGLATAAGCQLVASTDLMLTMPSSYAAGFSRLLPLATQALPIKLRPIPILAYWHPSRDHDRAHTWFRQLLIDTVRAAPEFAGH